MATDCNSIEEVRKVFSGVSSNFIEKEKNRCLIENEFNLNKVNILEVLESDLEEILELQILAYQSEAINCNDFDIPPLKVNIEELKEELKNKRFFKAVYNDKIIGSVRGYEEERVCYIEKLMVHDDYQNMGIGKQLLKYIEKSFINIDRYELFTGSKSEKNIKFYHKSGYESYNEKRVNENYGIIYLKKSIGGDK